MTQLDFDLLYKEVRENCFSLHNYLPTNINDLNGFQEFVCALMDEYKNALTLIEEAQDRYNALEDDYNDLSNERDNLLNELNDLTN